MGTFWDFCAPFYDIAEKAGGGVYEKMLNIARRKITRRNVKNITIATQSIYTLAYPNNSFDVAIAGQILHLIDEPEKAAAELRRVAKTAVILPMSFTKNIKGMAKLGVNIYRIFGFAPKIEFTPDEYTTFLPSIGFENCEYIQIPGNISMAVAVWKNPAAPPINWRE
jgi:ubiquinone/menaquinone biosynthesis C-methylase UbiE